MVCRRIYKPVAVMTSESICSPILQVEIVIVTELFFYSFSLFSKLVRIPEKEMDQRKWMNVSQALAKLQDMSSCESDGEEISGLSDASRSSESDSDFETECDREPHGKGITAAGQTKPLMPGRSPKLDIYSRHNA